MGELGVGSAVEQLGDELKRRGAGSVVGFVWVGAGLRGELLHRVGRVVGVDQQLQGRVADPGNGRKIVGPVGQAVAHGMVKNHRPGRAHHQGVAVGLGLGHKGRAHHRAHAGPVFHHHGLANQGGQFFSHDAGSEVHPAAGGVAHHNGHGFVGPGLGQHRLRHGGGQHSGSGGQQASKVSSFQPVCLLKDGNFHCKPSCTFSTALRPASMASRHRAMAAST